MFDMDFDYYNFEELYKKWEKNDTKENRLALLEWCEKYTLVNNNWNGERFSFCHEDFELKPILSYDEEHDQYDTIDVDISGYLPDDYFDIEEEDCEDD